MRKICFSVCILLIILLIFSGCGKAAPNNSSDSSAPADSDKTMITITSNGETTLPYLRWSWGDSWTGDGWVSGDAIQLICELPDIAKELPVVSYHDDFKVQYEEGVSYSYMWVYDDSFEYLHHIAPYDDIDYLTCLAQLPEGTYYIAIAVVKHGEYIEAGDGYRNNGYDCVFKLVVGQ